MGLRCGDEELPSRCAVQNVEALNDVLVADELFRLFLWRLVYRSQGL